MNALPTTSHPVNQNEVNKLLSFFSKNEEKQLLQKVTQKIQHITFPILKEKLNQCLCDLNPLIKDKKYAIGFAPEKSSEWIFKLVESELETKPSLVFKIKNEGPGFIEVCREVFETEFSLVKDETIVVFEDCWYSDLHIKNFLKAFDKEFSQRTCSKKNIIVVTPFVTESVLTCSSFFSFINLQIITSDYRIQTFEEIFSKDEINFFNSRRASINWINIFSGANPNTTLCYTDWCISKESFLLTSLSRGFIIQEGNRIEYCLIPPIQRPYSVLQALGLFDP